MQPAPKTPEQEQDEVLPTFSEQAASQLGGVKGMIEASVPVFAFVVVNIFSSLIPALIVAIALAIGIAVFRLIRKQTPRHALNGLLGIGIGAYLAWKSGKAQDFYLPGIFYSLAIGVGMVGSVALRRPLVGFVWSLVADQGATRWRLDAGLRRIFGWLTVVWAATYFVKVVVNFWVYFADGLTDDQKASFLGIMRITLGYPPYLLLVALTVWAVRRYLRSQDQAVPA